MAKKTTRIWGIWCKDRNDDKGDWMRGDDPNGLIVFTSKRHACTAAAVEYGFPSYTAAKKRDWVDVRELR